MSWGDIASYHGVQSELMAHWQGLFSDRIMTVHYESLVDDLETNARGLIEHLSLTWSDQCLTFHQAQRAVQTASAPSGTTAYLSGLRCSAGENYEKFLEPVFGPPTQSSH